MGYDIFKFGALYLDDKIQPVPQRPNGNGDIPRYDGKSAISIGATAKEKSITWIKPNGRNLLVADRTLLVSVSQEDLYKNGFVDGEMVLFDGQYFRCRLLRVGEDKDVPNEWDAILDETGEDNTLWHWEDIYFWGDEVFSSFLSCAVRGWVSARCWDVRDATRRSVRVGFRPALEPLGPDNLKSNCTLDGTNFCLSSIPGGDGFCLILQPVQKDVFTGIPDGQQVRMYTIVEDGHPVCFGTQVKDMSRLTLTDHYFGNEYLVPWTISNGVAVANQLLL